MLSDASRAGPVLPAIDEHLVEPETPYEMHDGELVYVPPADPPHGERHLQLSALIAIHIAPAFNAAVDLLMRTSLGNDFAPDVSVFPRAPDPETGGRQPDRLAFEIVSTESLSHASGKAAKLTARGVGRVFAIDIERSRALEWSSALDTWRVLDDDGHIEDPSLAVALPIDKLICAAEIDDVAARALLAKGNPVLQAKAELDRAAGHAEGVARGKSEAVLALLAARGIPLHDADRDRILGERDPQTLDRWVVQAIIVAAVAELLAEP